MSNMIKFRGKNKDGEWFKGSLVDCGDFLSILPVEVLQNTPIDLVGAEIVRHSVSAEAIGQYIGRCDKDGNEIYVGDILRNDEYPLSDGDVKDNYFAVAEWCSDESSFGLEIRKNPKSKVMGLSNGSPCTLESWEPSQWEIVGNVYDTPELVGKDWVDESFWED